LASAHTGVRGAVAVHSFDAPEKKAEAAKDDDKKKTDEKKSETSTPELDTTSVDFEMKDVNYYDLTETYQEPEGETTTADEDPNDWMTTMNDDAPPKGDKGKKGGKGKKPPTTDDEPFAGATALGGLGDVADSIDSGFDDMVGDTETTKTKTTAGGKKAAPTTTEVGSETANDIDQGMDSVFGPPAPTAKGGKGKDTSGMPWPVKLLLARKSQMINKAEPAAAVAAPAAAPVVPASPAAAALAAAPAAVVVVAVPPALPKKMDGKVTVQKALRRSIEGAVKHMLCAPLAGPAPGPAPGPAIAPVKSMGAPSPAAPVNLLRLKADVAAAPAAVRAMAPGPAPGPMACPHPKIHVAFLPGDKMRKKHHDKMVNAAGATPRGVKVKVTVFDKPGNGVDDMKMAAKEIEDGLKSGVLQGTLELAVKAVTGKTPKMGGLGVKSAIVKAWDIKKCQGHMSKLVKSFTLHYTARQVPMALYNECTTFLTKMTFSHDHVLDHRDTNKCQKATANFAKKWKVSGKKNDPKHFEGMCVTFCEAKFGNDAPVCHLSGGDELADAPL